MSAIAAILDFRSERFKLFLIYESPKCFLPSFESIGLSVQEKTGEIDVQDACHGGHLWFPIGTILTTFYLQVTSMLPTKFCVRWPFGSGEESKNRFSRWLPWRPSWATDRNDFIFFFIYKSPRCFLQSFESVGLSVKEKKRKIYFEDGRYCRHLGFPIGMTLAIFNLQVTAMFLTKFRVNWPFGSGEEANCVHLGFPI